MRLEPRVLAFALLLLAAPSAHAYPQYIAHGYAQCSGCHVSATGGGVVSAMGQGSVEALIGDLVRVRPLSRLRAAVAKPELTGRDEDDRPSPQLALGLDSRVLFLRTQREVDADPTFVPIPMLAEVGAVAAYGPALAYLTLTPRRRTIAEPAVTLASREHWLGFDLGTEHRLRAGRMVLPFGLRMPDHTLYTREDFGFNKWDQSYGLGWDYVGDALEVHAAAFAGDLWLDAPGLQERGLAASVSYALLDERLSVGASALFGMTQYTRRPAASVFLRARPVGRTYVVGELAAQRRTAIETNRGQNGAAGFLRLGWFPHASTDLFVELAGRTLQGGSELIKLRYQFGINTHLLPWVELSPALVLEEDVETGLKPTFLAQVHLFY